MFSFAFFGAHCTISATKCSDGHLGLVRVSGWSNALATAKAIALTITDEDENTCWTHMIEKSLTSCNTEPFEKNVPLSSIAHRISVTARVLKQDPSVIEGGLEHLTVDFKTLCQAIDQLYLPLNPSVELPLPTPVPNTLEIEIKQTTTVNKATVVIGRTLTHVTDWKITVKRDNTTDHKEHVFRVRKQPFFSAQEFEFPLTFRAGQKYKVVAQGLVVSNTFSPLHNNEYRIVVSGSASFKAELTTGDIGTLHQKALNHVKYSGNSSCVYLYRNKPEYYFNDIFQNHGGLMEVYMKDNSGDPGSPINDRIKGLFFMASVEPGTTSGQPARVSAFGSTRLLVPAKELLQLAPNLYFSDFYCMRGQFHYVTLVMTRPGSETDRFCAERLLSLSVNDSSNNPFLFYDCSGQLKVSTRDHLHVELLFTENLDINRYRYELQCNTPLVGKGQSTPGGIPKNPYCATCNLSTPHFLLGWQGRPTQTKPQDGFSFYCALFELLPKILHL